MSSPPAMPDVEPSRGDEHHSSSHHKRHSKGHHHHHHHSKKSEPSSRRSSHRRSSTSKSEKSPTQGEHSPRRSAGGSITSSGKTPESSKSHHKLRLAPGTAQETRSPPLLSPFAPLDSTPSDKGDLSGRSSTLSSRDSGGRYSKTPTSKRDEKRERNLRIALPGAVAAPRPLLDHPGDSIATRSAARFSQMTSSSSPVPPASNVDQILIGQDPATRAVSNINNDQHWVQLQATAAPNVDEIEAARLQGREEGRKQRETEHQVPGESGALLHHQPSVVGDNMVFVAAPAPKDKSARKYAFASFVIVVIAAAIVVWQVMTKGKDDPIPAGPTPFNPPTKDDCLAVSQGLAVVGQNETTVRTFAVEINIAVNSGMNLALLKAELEIRTQRYVLPLLVGCQLDGPIIIENNNFVIADALLEQMTMGEPKACDIATLTSPECSLAYMEMDLFLKDPEVSSDYILELIAFVFQHEGLLELLDLITPVEIIDTLAQYEVLDTSPAPSFNPSSSPSIKPVGLLPDGLPTEEECLEIASGIGNGSGRGVLQEYDIYLDVMLDILKDDLTEITLELQQKLQRFLMPALAGCDPSFVGNPGGDASNNPGGANPDGSPSSFVGGSSALNDDNNRRRLQTEGLILDAKNEAEYLRSGLCLTESEPPCYRYVIHLDIFVKSIVASADFTQPIMTKFKEEPLVERLGLLSPFVKITIVDTIAQTPSAMPSIAPSASPSTPAPSQMPSMVPSTRPSESPSGEPSLQPTGMPTPRPTPGPTPNPTPWPTRPPTRNPTPWPTPSPTRRPTPWPTPPPTLPCIQSNSDLTSAVYDYNNVYAPSSMPGYYPTPPTSPPAYYPSPSVSPRDAIVAQYGPIGNWCFGPSVNSMAFLFQYTSFNEDISGWDVSGITDMSYMFYYTTSFNQNIGGWDVSSVTDMSNMFNSAYSFNGNIGGWDVSSVTGTSYMFFYASAFNQDLSNWQLTSLSSAYSMFGYAGNFNQDLCDWGGRIPTSASVYSMFTSTSCAYTYDPYLYDYPPYSPAGPFCHYCYSR